MDRLTERDGAGYAHVIGIADGNMALRFGLVDSQFEILMSAINRLAAYEDADDLLGMLMPVAQCTDCFYCSAIGGIDSLWCRYHKKYINNNKESACLFGFSAEDSLNGRSR